MLFYRLTYEQQQAYLARLAERADSESEDDYRNVGSDSEDEEWLPPQPSNVHKMSDMSDVEDVYNATDIEIELDESAENELDEAASDDDVTEEDYHTDAGPNTGTSSESAFVSKDGTIWKKTAPKVTRVQRHNILRQKPGPVPSTKCLSAAQTFKCIFSEEMIDIIVRETNRKADRVYAKWNAENPDKPAKKLKEFTQDELYAYIGILITMGVHHSNSEPVNVLWKSDSYPLYRATTPINRFRDICRFIRFDNENTRNDRLQSDKAAAITDIWLMLNANLSSKYVASDCVTVDEQLFPYRGRTRFT